MDNEVEKYLIKLELVYQRHPEYKKEAYSFILSALNYTVGKLDIPRHVNGKELSFGIKDYAIEQFGPLAKTVLEFWGINSTGDFGKIVFYLIEVALLGKTEHDRIEDFDNVFAFETAFDVEVEYEI